MDKKFMIRILLPIGSTFMIRTVILLIVLFVLVYIFPLPIQVSLTLIVANILFALTILIAVLITRKTSGYSFLPILLLISNLFSMVVFFAVPRSILTMRMEFDEANRSVYFLLANYEKTVHLIIGAIVSFFIIVINIIFSIKTAIYVAEVAAWFNLNSMREELRIIETKQCSGEINEEEADSRKWAMLKKFDSLLYEACRFISCNVKLSLFYVGTNAIGGILIDILFNYKSFNEAAVTYIPLTIVNIYCLGSYLLLPSLLVLLAAKIAIGRYVREHPVTEDAADLTPPDPLSLELPERVRKSIRQELARDLPPAIIATHLAEIIKRHAAEIQNL